MRKNDFIEGLKGGLPICMGYFSVSMAFGLSAVSRGMGVLSTILISLTNLTSAGQFAGVNVLLAMGGLAELFLTTLIINMRYFLMSLTMSQKVDDKMPLWQRFIYSFAITDEVFAVSVQRKESLNSSFLAGLVLSPPIGWTLGTVTGALATSVMPQSLCAALGIALYGMFIAIIIPPARDDKKILSAVIMAVILSIVFTYAPFLKNISGGWMVILITVCVSALAATFFPIEGGEKK